MKKVSVFIIAFFFFLFGKNPCIAVSWEKLYVKKSTDCFRCVREVPSDGYILAGYTANITPNDTDALALRLDEDGDTLWSFVYNGPSSKKDCFYKVIPTSDNGFIFCGFSRSFSSSDNAFFVKLNSNGNVQWVKNWGGSGIEKAEDIVEVSNGNFVICGSTTSSPALYYDAFILKIDQNGNTLWSKIYGGSLYDNANSILKLSDNGFLLGGQSNNQLYLIRTDSNGDSLWTRSFGTSGMDEIKCVNFAQGGDGFILAGTTDGIGAGAEDAYLVRTDTGGNQMWAKTIGGSLNDGFHRIEHTNDGGYFACGTSSRGPWNNPNIWIIKMDSDGDEIWENFFGGENHDHGYTGQPTSDGGYIAAGHTRSFANTANIEDAIVFKTNSSGNVSNRLTWTEVTDLITPVSGGCGSSSAEIKVELTNWSVNSVSSIPVTVEITGAITQTITQTLNSSVSHNASKTLTFSTTVNMSAGGTYNFHIYTGNSIDVIPSYNFLNKSIVVNTSSQPPVVTDGSRCGPGTITLSASSPDQIKWYSSSSGGSSLQTGSTFTTPYLTSGSTYYVQAGTSCPSARVPVDATITPGLTVPAAVDGSRCSTGTVLLSGSSAYPIKWYSTSTSTTSLATGSSYTTPSLSSTSDYYIAADNGTCTSNRALVQAEINDIPDDPVTTSGITCGNGTVDLSANASDPVKWYTASSGGSQVGSGSNFTTPVLSSTTTYYAEADDGTCQSNRIPAVATVAPIPAPPATTSDFRCGTGSMVLTATATDPVKWYDAPSGGSQAGSGNTFTTPVLSATTTYYALTDNGPCRSNRIPAVATVESLPSPPVTTDESHCGTGSMVLTAVASDPVKWYDAVTGGSQVGSGSTFTTPVISATTTFYAVTDNGPCRSNRIPALATINPIPPDPIISTTHLCGPDSATLSVTASDPVVWFDAPVAGNQIGSGNSLITPVISSSTTFYAQANNGLCESNRIAGQIIVNPLPNLDLGPDTIYSSDSPYILDAGAGFSDYNWTPAGTLQIFTAYSSGNYCVTVTDANNCQATGCTYVEFSVDINQIELNNGLKVYPVPSKGFLTIESVNDKSKFYFSVIDLTGKTVFSKRINSTKETFDLSFLVKGLYILQLKDDQSASAYRLIID